MTELSYAMTPELIKKLKDANFPYAWTKTTWEHSCRDGHSFGVATCGYCVDLPKPSIPSLEEIIAGCGEKFGFLVQDFIHNTYGQWKAYSYYYAPTMELKDVRAGYGPTPSEAVSELWLKLNEKK